MVAVAVPHGPVGEAELCRVKAEVESLAEPVKVNVTVELFRVIEVKLIADGAMMVKVGIATVVAWFVPGGEYTRQRCSVADAPYRLPTASHATPKN